MSLLAVTTPQARPTSTMTSAIMGTAALPEGDEDLPAWLQEAGEALVSKTGPVREAPVAWNEVTRVLEDKRAVEEILQQKNARLENQDQLLEQSRREAEAEASRAKALQAQNVELSKKLKQAQDEILRLEKAELAAQMKLVQRQHDESELCTLLAKERHQTEKRLNQISSEAVDNLSRAVAELRRENEILRAELTKARASLAGGLFGSMTMGTSIGVPPRTKLGNLPGGNCRSVEVHSDLSEKARVLSSAAKAQERARGLLRGQGDKENDAACFSVCHTARVF
jgi:myosin heavy subunit